MEYSKEDLMEAKKQGPGPHTARQATTETPGP